VLWYPTQAKVRWFDPISCHAVLERSACAPFIKERRMESINAANLHRKSGQWGIQPLLLGCESITLDGINERSGQNAFLRSPGDRFHPANPKDPCEATG
jgi:hypothetical protein